MLKFFWHSHPLVRQVTALAYTALLTLILLQSSSQPIVGPAAPPGDPDPAREIILTTGHIVGFVLLVLVWWWAFVSHSGSRRALFISAIIALVLSVMTELLQTLVPDRSASLFDLIVNTLVTLATVWMIYIRSGTILT
jgi:VanZ family protein